MTWIKRMPIEPRTLRIVRDLCPKKGSGIDSMTITGGGESVTLTAETRDKINARLRRPK